VTIVTACTPGTRYPHRRPALLRHQARQDTISAERNTGAGVYCVGGCQLTAVDCVFYNNTAIAGTVPSVLYPGVAV
jgi:cyanophycinase-like exopeptidase